MSEKPFAKLFTPCPKCGQDPTPTNDEGRCGKCGAWQVIALEEVSAVRLGRNCIVCGEGFDLMGVGDNRTICPDCCATIKSIKNNRKISWIPNSRGGEPNFYDSVNEEYKQLYMQQPICDVEPEQRTRQNDICDLCHRQTRSIRPLRAARIPTRENHGLEWACESCYEKEQERVKKIVEEMPNET